MAEIPTVFDEGIEILRSLKAKAEWDFLTLEEGLSELASHDISFAARARELLGRDDWEADPSNPVGAAYVDIVHEGWESDGEIPVKKSILAAPHGKVVRDLMEARSPLGIKHDPKQQYFSWMISYDEENIFVAAVSQAMAEEALESSIRQISLLADNIKKHWHVVKEADGEWYERTLSDNLQNAACAIIFGVLEEAELREMAMRGYKQATGEFFPREKRGFLSKKEIERFLNPDTRKQAMAEDRAAQEEDEAIQREALRETTQVIRIRKTQETTAVLQERLGIRFGRGQGTA